LILHEINQKNFHFMKLQAILIMLISGLLIPFHQGYCGNNSDPGNKKSKFSSFYKTGIKVDGNPAEWPSGMFYCNSDAMVFFATVNDSSHLYFCLQIPDPKEQMDILRDGLELWVDPQGKKKKSYSIRVTCVRKPGMKQPVEAGNNRTRPFPGDTLTPPRGTQALGGDRRKAVPQGQYKSMPKQEFKSFPVEIKTTGFLEEFSSPGFSVTKDQGFAASFANDTTGTLVLELRIPLNAFPVNPMLSKSVALGFEIVKKGDEDRPSAPPGRPEGGPPGGRSGPGGGGMSGDGPGGGGMSGGGRGMGGPGGPPSGGELRNQPTTCRIWHKFSLAPAQ
jgi:hypothetical protein